MGRKSVSGKQIAEIAAEAIGKRNYDPIEFIVWLFRHADIELEEDLVAIWDKGAPVVGSDLDPADVVFRTGKPARLLPTKRYAGHLGVFVGGKERDIVHVDPDSGRITKVPINDFLEEGSFRGTRRLIASS
ncbi:MAG: hypothetical protein QY323_04850 [Patescibacteria group bacterium]|nr:MAG: hypothetical protein QY323_04850 [Patescibacteria group bacterium]